MKSKTSALAAAVAAVVVPSLATASDIPVRMVASYPVGLVGSWALSENGRIAYRTYTPGANTVRLDLATNQTAVLASQNDPVSGFPVGRTLAGMVTFGLTDAGGAVGIGQDNLGQYAVVSGQRPSLTSVFRSGDAVAQLPGVEVQLDTFRRVVSNRGGQYLIDAYIPQLGRAVTLFGGPSQTRAPLMQPGATAPVMGGTLESFYGGAINNNGRIAVQAQTLQPNPQTALYTGTPGDWTLRLRTGDAVGPAASVVTSVFGMRYTDSDRLLAMVEFGHSSHEALVSSAPGQATQLVFERGTRGPGMAPDERFEDSYTAMFANSFQNNAGHIVTSATIRSASLGDGRGLWYGSGDSMQLVLRNGAAATGYTGVTLNSFSVMAMNNAEDVVLFTELAGAGVTSANRFAYYYWNSSGGLTPIIRSGDTVVYQGVTRTVNSFWVTTQVGWFDSQEVLNDLHQFAFTVQFTDGTNGLMVATVPAPSCAAVLVIAGVVAQRRRR